MNKDDREEIREMVQDVLSGHTNEMIGRLNVIAITLNSVDLQVKKTNGRVNDIEHDIDKIKRQDIEHILNCPVNEKVKNLDKSIKKEIEDLELSVSERIKPFEINEITRKAVTKFYLLIWLIVGSTAGALVFGILKYIFSGE